MKIELLAAVVLSVSAATGSIISTATCRASDINHGAFDAAGPTFCFADVPGEDVFAFGSMAFSESLTRMAMSFSAEARARVPSPQFVTTAAAVVDLRASGVFVGSTPGPVRPGWAYISIDGGGFIGLDSFAQIDVRFGSRNVSFRKTGFLLTCGECSPAPFVDPFLLGQPYSGTMTLQAFVAADNGGVTANAQAGNGNFNISVRFAELDGSPVDAIPEPGSLILASLGGLALLIFAKARPVV